MAASDHYGFLNTVEGLNELSIEALPELLTRFPAPHTATIVAASPSHSLIDRILSNRFELAPVRPIAYLCLNSTIKPDDDDRWQIHEVSEPQDEGSFANLLDSGYDATSAVNDFIRADHAHPEVRSARQSKRPKSGQGRIHSHRTNSLALPSCELIARTLKRPREKTFSQLTSL